MTKMNLNLDQLYKKFKKFTSGEFIDELFYMGDWKSSTMGGFYSRKIQRKCKAFNKTNPNKNVHCSKGDCVTTEGDCV